MDGAATHVAAPTQDGTALVQSTSDERLIALWLDGRPETTRRAYARDASSFMLYAGVPIQAVTLGHLQAYAHSIEHLAPASRARKLASLKSLFGFAHRLGYVPFDAARPLRLPKLKDALSARIVGEAEVLRMIVLEPNPRNHAMLRVLYATGLRISELCALRWSDLRGTKTGGQAAVFGKGAKTRVVLLLPKVWRQLAALRGPAGCGAGPAKRQSRLRDPAGPEAPVFRSGRGDALDRSAAHRIVKAAARRAGLPDELSAHWLRHAHASHSLDHGAPLHVLQASLGHGSLSTTTRYVHARPGDGSAKYLPE